VNERVGQLTTGVVYVLVHWWG